MHATAAIRFRVARTRSGGATRARANAAYAVPVVGPVAWCDMVRVGACGAPRVGPQRTDGPT